MHPKLRRGEIDPSRNLGVLVMEFFELYGKYFNYSETGISLRHGGTYFSKARRGWIDPRKRHLLSIEDPGDISEFLRNIGLQPNIRLMVTRQRCVAWLVRHRERPSDICRSVRDYEIRGVHSGGHLTLKTARGGVQSPYGTLRFRQSRPS